MTTPKSYNELAELMKKEDHTEFKKVGYDTAEINKIADQLYNAFVWSNTPDSVEFWNYVYERLRHLGSLKP